MARTTLLSLILVLSLVGLADSWYLAESAVTDTPLVCGPGVLEGCNAVAQSPYSKLFGIPLGMYGVGFYGLIFLLSLIAFKSSKRVVAGGLLLVSGAGALASVAFLYIQFFLIKALCVYCVLSAVVSFVLCALAFYYFKQKQGRTPPAEEKPVTP
jgi:uncharacterized membrane protein